MNNVCIHIGFPKAGSTFLQAYFEAHPHVKLNSDALGNYRATGKIDRSTFDVSSLNESLVLSDEELSVWSGGLATSGVERYNTDYDVKNHQRYVAEKLAEVFPNAKILIVLRGPGSLIQSLYSQYLMNGGYEGFSRFLDHNAKTVFQMFDYGHVCQLYELAFGRENVLVLPFELLKNNRGEFIGLMEQFFQIPHSYVELDSVNRSIPMKFRPSVRFLSFLVRGLIRPLPLEFRRRVFYRYTEKLYHAKETWMAKYDDDNGQNKSEEELLNSYLKRYYRPYSGLLDHAHFNPFIDKYLV